jgi:hypothetical protein
MAIIDAAIDDFVEGAAPRSNFSPGLMPGHLRARPDALDPHSPACRLPIRPNTTDPNMQGYQ